MTDPRAQFADSLREHQLGFAEPDGGFCCASSRCDWTGHNYDFVDHLADMLLSLPGVAIVELPDEYDYGWDVPSCGEFNGVESTGDSVISVEINSYGIEAHTLGEMTPLEARLLAAALLAAVNAAEREAK